MPRTDTKPSNITVTKPDGTKIEQGPHGETLVNGKPIDLAGKVAEETKVNGEKKEKLTKLVKVVVDGQEHEVSVPVTDKGQYWSYVQIPAELKATLIVRAQLGGFKNSADAKEFSDVRYARHILAQHSGFGIENLPEEWRDVCPPKAEAKVQTPQEKAVAGAVKTLSTNPGMRGKLAEFLRGQASADEESAAILKILESLGN